MSFAGNRLVDLNGVTDPDLFRLQRQQRYADMLRDQASAEIPVYSGGGVQAPISPFAVIGKMLAAYGANRRQNEVEEQYQQYRDKDSAAAQALARSLTGGDKVAPPALPPVQTQLPGGQTINVGGQQAAPSVPTSQEQLAMILGATGGQQVQGIKSAMLPAIMQQQQFDRQHAQQIADRDLPMTRAAREQIEAQNSSALELAKQKNALPMSPYEQAQIGIAQQKLAAMNSTGRAEDGSFLPRIANFGRNVVAGNMTFQSVPAKDKGAVSDWLAEQNAYNPLAGTRLTLESDRISAPYRKMSGYELTAGAQPYIDRIEAALKNPSSVGDADALDALVKLNTGGNAVTDAQVHLVTGNRSFADTLNVWKNKMAKQGGALSDDQRKQVASVANEIVKNYAKSYQPIYDQASEQLQAAHIPKQFWTIPDLNKLRERRLAADAKTKSPVGGTSKEVSPSGGWGKATVDNP